ncbi:MAG TPA: homoserine dehydrogenase, partial [Lachnospiraceae bacterium]|nr:homoserine dehydrogenase [Lachnospiraceae bacterium]
TTDDQGMIDESFGEGVEYIDADIVPGEVGFITPEMEQRAFDEKAGKLTGVVNSIRLA